jgi:hypothetical protein
MVYRDPHYLLGRFYTVRSMYSACNRVADRFRPRPTPPAAPREGLLTGLDPRRAVEDLRRDAVSHGFSLAPWAVEEVRDFAGRAECAASLGGDRPHRPAEVADGRLDGRPVAVSYVREPLACPAVREVMGHPALRRVVEDYLGYVPRRAEVRLYWSHVVSMTLEERRAQLHTVEYHFDVHDFNFCYVHIYLTPVAADSGAHVMVKGSHRRKPVRWLFGSARQPDEAISRAYPAADIVTLTGRPGDGFIEDTSCYHKALAPVSGPRLMFQVRYH